MYKILGQDGKEYGPVSADIVRQWHAQGRVNAQTRVCAEGSMEWKALVEVPELAGLAAGAAPTAAPMAAAASVASTGPQSGLAIASLVLGVLSLLCGGILLGLPAVITGHMALGRVRRSPAQYGGKGLAIAGLALGYASVLLTLIIMALLLPALAQAKSRATSVACMNNLKQIGLGARIYASDNNDTLPKDFLSMSNELNTPRILWCPADTSKSRVDSWAAYSPAHVSYEFLTPGAKDRDLTRTPVFRCPIHKSICFGDGSVQRGDQGGPGMGRTRPR
jgi:hypothetical protein